MSRAVLLLVVLLAVCGGGYGLPARSGEVARSAEKTSSESSESSETHEATGLQSNMKTIDGAVEDGNVTEAGVDREDNGPAEQGATSEEVIASERSRHTYHVEEQPPHLRQLKAGQ